ncbi:MAG: ATP-binding protein, partial [Thermoplasmatota archaeon]
MEGVGVIYGQVGSTRFDVAVHDPNLRRLDYIAVEHNGNRVLGQVQEVVRKSKLSFEEAMRLQERGHDVAEDQLSATVHVIGFKDVQGRVQSPRTPFRAGLTVERAEDALVTGVLGLQGAAHDGAHLGNVKGSKIPVSLSLNTLAQKHLSVLAKTGAGKSYTVGVILEEFLKAQVPMVILDPHGEYGSLRHANVKEREIKAMRRFGIKPKAFQKQIKEYAIDTRVNPEGERLVMEGMNLEGREIVDLVGGKISGGQVGVLYQAVKEVQDHLPAYTLKDVMDAVSRNKSNSKWNVLNALEALDATRIFDIRGTPVDQLVQPAQCTIVNLRGVAPDIQEIVVTRLCNLLWEARKRNEVPPFILVCEEAHNFCPERGVGNAISGPVLRTVAAEGRKFGMGLVIVSQRPAKIDKNVLSQCNTQVVLKVTNPNDIKSIVASVEGITSETADEVQRLPIGSALVAGGGLTQPVFVDIRPRHSRHGGESIDVVGKDVPKAEPVAKSAPKPTFVPPPEPEPEPEPALEPGVSIRKSSVHVPSRPVNAPAWQPRPVEEPEEAVVEEPVDDVFDDPEPEPIEVMIPEPEEEPEPVPAPRKQVREAPPPPPPKKEQTF